MFMYFGKEESKGVTSTSTLLSSQAIASACGSSKILSIEVLFGGHSVSVYHLSLDGFPRAVVHLNHNGETALVENPGRTALERSDFSRSIQDLFLSKSHTKQSGSLYKFFSGIKRMKVTIPVMHPEGHCFNVRYAA